MKREYAKYGFNYYFKYLFVLTEHVASCILSWQAVFVFIISAPEFLRNDADKFLNNFFNLLFG
jgi:hypothetical protein